MSSLLQGTVLILISNIIYISNNYIVAWTGLEATEVALVRGSLQVLVFGLIICWKETRRKESNDPEEGEVEAKEEKNLKQRIVLYILVALYGFTVSTMSFSATAAIQFMPIGDLIVISFCSPVFSVFLDRIVLKRPITFLAIFLCLLMVVGEVLVIKPPFIFGQSDGTTEDSSSLSSTGNITSASDSHQEQISTDNGLYYLGVLLSLYVAIAGAAANVLNAKCDQLGVTTSQLMLVSGFSSLILSFISSIFILNRILVNPLSFTLKGAVLLPVSGVLTMIAYWTITLAVSITSHPTLINMLRSTEIILSLITECIWWSRLPTLLSLLGSLLVAGCVICMTGHDSIIKRFQDTFSQCGRRGETDKETKNHSVSL